MDRATTGYPFPAELVERVSARRGKLHCYDQLDPRRTALVVVDMQTAFLKEGWPTACDPARDVVPAINRLADAVRRTGGEIIWVISTYGPDEADRWQVLFDHVMGPAAGGNFRAVLTEGHEGHAIWPLLDYRPGEAVVAKNRFSAFCGSKGRLEKLLRELRTAMERFPLEGNDVFVRLRGKLAWPVSGRLVARFGDARAGGVHWDGVLVATERGAPVKAVCQGRVIYADWLPGLGLLTIVDHGDGYLSLYGHNERLYKAAGEPVTAGEPIAAAGDSGGSSRPELYFEIRKGGKPVDPRPWFRAANP